MTVQRLRVDPLEERQTHAPERVVVQAVSSNLLQPPAPPSPPVAGVADVVLAAFAGLGYALSARALLLLALIGGFVLAVMAIRIGSTAALLVLIAYGVLVMLPLVFLEVRKRN
jgi:hypothetical protein